MDLTEWIISISLILVVVTQIRGRKLTLVGLLWPVPLVIWGAINYLSGIPGYAADWSFVAACFDAGVGLGAGCGFLTDVYVENGVVKARARWLAAILWLMGTGGRLAFGLFALNGGGPAIAKASKALGIHSANTWASGLIVMALCEVLTRSTVLFVRSRSLKKSDAQPEELHAQSAR
ncbi:MAG: DUF1453 domain-containing protein [Microbacterium sp.]